MTLQFGAHDTQFENAPLTTVLCQITFSPIYALLSPSGVAGFQDAIRGRYPTADVERSVAVQPGEEGIRVDQTVPTWRFSDDEGWTVALSINFVALTTDSYLNFEEFIDRLNFVLDAVDRTLQPSDSSRIGLRKINAISHPDVQQPTDWAALIRPELAGLLAAPEMAGTLAGGSAEAQLVDGDEGILMIRHGVWNDLEDHDLAKDLQKVDLRFRLDLDYFTHRPFAIKGSDDLSALLGDYSNSITSFFTWCLGPALYEYLGPVPRPAPAANGDDKT